MIPQVVQVFHLYPEACEDLFRYTISGELADVGTDGVTKPARQSLLMWMKPRNYTGA